MAALRRDAGPAQKQAQYQKWLERQVHLSRLRRPMSTGAREDWVWKAEMLPANLVEGERTACSSRSPWTAASSLSCRLALTLVVGTPCACQLSRNTRCTHEVLAHAEPTKLTAPCNCMVKLTGCISFAIPDPSPRVHQDNNETA